MAKAARGTVRATLIDASTPPTGTVRPVIAVCSYREAWRDDESGCYGALIGWLGFPGSADTEVQLSIPRSSQCRYERLNPNESAPIRTRLRAHTVSRLNQLRDTNLRPR